MVYISPWLLILTNQLLSLIASDISGAPRGPEAQEEGGSSEVWWPGRAKQRAQGGPDPATL